MASPAAPSRKHSRETGTFVCPIDGCQKRFCELWKCELWKCPALCAVCTKAPTIHVKAPRSAIKGQGGHGQDLLACPKCSQPLQPGRAHLGCQAGLSAPSQAVKRRRMQERKKALRRASSWEPPDMQPPLPPPISRAASDFLTPEAAAAAAAASSSSGSPERPTYPRFRQESFASPQQLHNLSYHQAHNYTASPPSSAASPTNSGSGGPANPPPAVASSTIKHLVQAFVQNLMQDAQPIPGDGQQVQCTSCSGGCSGHAGAPLPPPLPHLHTGGTYAVAAQPNPFAERGPWAPAMPPAAPAAPVPQGWLPQAPQQQPQQHAAVATESNGAWRVMSGWGDACEDRASQPVSEWRAAAAAPLLEPAASVTAAQAANLLRLGPGGSSGSSSTTFRPQLSADQGAAAFCWGEEAAASSWEAHAQQHHAQQQQQTQQLQAQQQCEYGGCSDAAAAANGMAAPAEAALADFSALLGGGGGADMLLDMLSDSGRAPEHEWYHTSCFTPPMPTMTSPVSGY